MTTKKILITGLDSAASEESIRAWLGHFGPVTRVEIISEGDVSDPVALVEMSISDETAAHLISRLSNYWHDGRLINARLLHH